MPMPSSSTVTSIHCPATRARKVMVPPAGEYLMAFSSSWPTMMSVAMVVLLAVGRSAAMSATTTWLPDRGPPLGVAELVPPAGQGAGEHLDHRDRRAQLVTRGGQEKILRLFELVD